MSQNINAIQAQEIKALINNSLLQKDEMPIHNFIRLMADTDMDGEDIIHVVIVSEKDSDIIPYESTIKMMTAIYDYLSDNDIPHIPVSYQITNEEWPKFRKEFAHAIALAN